MVRQLIALAVFCITISSEAHAVEIDLTKYPSVEAKSSLLDKAAAEFILGSDLSRVRENISSSYASFKATEMTPSVEANINFEGTRINTRILPFLRNIRLTHSSPDQSETWDLHLTSPTTNSRLYAVVRNVSYPAGAKISPSDILAAVVSRYGPPQFQTDDEGSWFYEHSGSPNDGWQTCRQMSGKIQSWLSNPSNFLNSYQDALRYTDAKCGGVISISISKDANGQASSFRFVAYDGTLDVSDRYNVFASMKLDLEKAAAEAEAARAKPSTPKF